MILRLSPEKAAARAAAKAAAAKAKAAAQPAPKRVQTPPPLQPAPPPPLTAGELLTALYAATHAPVFDRQQPVPLAIGIHRGLGNRARRLIQKLVRTREYLAALQADGSMRHGLDGQAVGPVSDEHRAGLRGRKP